MFTRVGDNWLQISSLRCLFSLIFNFPGVSFLLQNLLIALARLGLILGSHSSSLLNSSVSSHKMSSMWPSHCGSVLLTTNITLRRGSSSSSCKLSSTFEDAKRLSSFFHWDHWREHQSVTFPYYGLTAVH